MAYIIELLKYIILGIIQGITEIFPVSSSGHLVLFSHLFLGGEDLNQTLTLFLIITNMGSFLALVLYYWHDIVLLVKDSFGFVFKKDLRVDPDVKSNFIYVLNILVAVIHIGIAGILFGDHLTTNLLS